MIGLDSSQNLLIGRRWQAFVSAVVFVTLLTLASHNATAELSAGAAKVDITPQVGVSLDGPISKNGTVKSIHDPLHARALVLDEGDSRIAIVIVDNCMTGRDVFDKAKNAIHQETGLPVNRILAAATHTHAAPRTGHIGRAKIDDEYHELVSNGVRDAVCLAIENLKPARIGYSSFRRPELIACRRFRCQPGTVDVNPFGFGGEEIKSVAGRTTGLIGPAGPIDPQFSVLSVQHADGTPLCVLGNFSVHYCGGYQRGVVSADYFGVYCRELESLLTREGVRGEEYPDFIGIMSNGTSGNTGAFQSSTGKNFKPFEGMNHYGRMLADETMQVLEQIEYASEPKIAMIQRQVTLGVRKPDPDRLQWAADVLANPKAKHPHRWSITYAQEAQHLASYPDTKSIILQAIRIGDVGIGSAPSEVFAETGLAIKEGSPIPHTFTIELANGYGGYLPPREQHMLGGYETWPARSSYLEIDAESKIREAILEMLTEIK